MIKFGAKDYELVKKEFDKGNNMWLAKSKEPNKYKLTKEIILIKRMSKNIGVYITYDITDGCFTDDCRKDIFESDFNSWNFTDFKLYILTKKEAKPYLKMLKKEQMAEIIIGKKIKTDLFKRIKNKKTKTCRNCVHFYKVPMADYCNKCIWEEFPAEVNQMSLGTLPHG